MNNIINRRRSLITTNNATNLLFISTVGPPSQAWDPDPYVKTWLGKGEEQLTQQVAWLVKSRKRIVTMNNVL